MTARLAALLLLAALWPGAAWAGAASLSHEIEARLDPATGELALRDRIAVEGLDLLRLHVAPWLRLERAELDGRPLAPKAAGGVLLVALPDRAAHGLDLRLRGRVPSPEGGPGRAGQAVSGPEGAYLPGHVAWVPWSEQGTAGYRLRVEVPEPHRAVATGRLEEEQAEAGSYRAVFAARPAPEPPSLFAGPYRIGERQAGGIRLRTYFHQELAELSDQYLAASAGYLRRYEAEIGAYPYADFHVISAPLPVGLGFPNLTYIGRRILPLPFIRARSLAHEVLHNWWGNGVMVDYAGGNWAEGLTTYMADHALEAEEDPGKAREMRLGWLRDYAALPPERDQALVDFTAKSHDAAQVVGYNKAAFLFHMLKAEIGAAAFSAGLRDLWRKHRFETAAWTDLRAAFERAAGRDLGWFFAQWLERHGAPRPRIASAAPTAGGVALTIAQETPAYRLSLPVEVETEAGRRRETVRLEGAETSVTLTAGAKVLAVHVDPDHEVFRRLLPGEAPPILRDVTLSGRTVTILAAGEGAGEERARRLVERLLDTRPRYGTPADIDGATPVLVVGLSDRIGAVLDRLGLAAAPPAVAGAGTARVWTARRADGAPALVVAADDGEALAALLRPLPHYGGKSYLVFDGRRAVESGVWPSRGGPMTRRFGAGRNSTPSLRN